MTKKLDIDWDAQPLGKESDSEIARRLGVWPSVVWRYRRERGIPPVSNYIDWDAQPLGEVPDTVLAERLGVSPQAVWSARKVRGIGRFEG